MHCVGAAARSDQVLAYSRSGSEAAANIQCFGAFELTIKRAEVFLLLVRSLFSLGSLYFAENCLALLVIVEFKYVQDALSLVG